MSKNKIGPYLKYALSEIVLVVIGILIALSINNWNNSRLERNEEVKYLSKLIVDLEVDIKNLDEMIKIAQNKINASMDLLELNPPERAKDIELMDSLISTVFGWREFSPRLNTLNELTSSGKLSILQNDSIKTLLLSIEEKNRSEATMNEHIKREFHNYLYDRAAVLRIRYPMIDYRQALKERDPNIKKKNITEEDFSEMYAQSKAFLEDVSIHNGLSLATTNYYYSIKTYQSMIAQRERLIEFITQDLIENG